ncbi:hypothetical protein ACZ87_02826 [Candidatus Erwinia dacicola]|uniref:Uncharacterized protein n=1 Tax=Candidatus Erwinia dacicola TaxID=252393 RepID=A0A328TJU9_9GAMM|nr:hypothetical protein ACZ87_02826 [Candidatus Erwinia dacicola]
MMAIGHDQDFYSRLLRFFRAASDSCRMVFVGVNSVPSRSRAMMR